MGDTTKLDSRRRGVFPSPFRPGDAFITEVQGANSVTFRLVKRAEVPVLPLKRIKGRLYSTGKASDAAITAAIRAERDER